MTNLELVLNMLAEVATKEISKEENPKQFEESKKIARKGGSIAGNARKEIEQQTGKPVITSQNHFETFTKKKKIEFEKKH